MLPARKHSAVGLVAIALLFVPFRADSQPPNPPAPEPLKLVIPDKVQGKPGRILTIQATTNARTLVWLTASNKTADLIPAGDKAYFASPAGTHQIAVFGIRDNEVVGPVYCEIELGGDTPKPPDPPGPNPPSDSLGKAIADAFNLDSDLGKRESAKLLAMMYDQIAASALDKAYGTIADLIAADAAIRSRYVADSALPKTRAVAGEYLRQVLGKPTDPLTDEKRKTIAAAYRALSEALRRL
jgi:hypothetical protein